MKRSEINNALKDMEQMVKTCGFFLPPFCSFTPEEWGKKGHDYDEVRNNMLGWDITDFGLGDFDRTGFSLITLRNTKIYAEKLLFLIEGQSAAMHFHWKKMEDIINRGGGNVLIRVYESTADGSLSDSEVTVNSDGRSYKVPAGTVVTLHPGESITIYPYLYHDFHVEPHTGPVLLGEVSMRNNDEEDNRFYQPIGRFPEIEEDVPPYRLLCNEYPEAE
ncbi:D-lyxose/D-mannose family sugar isomerase [Clostridium boliviensis]|uniref:D-lyxose ketol-isomerase n=1 Tax=Clostridium boliviensis TaxID=318465 RepID=A0ABU4GPC6_9CLOT|nr:D-lyxose/D-mannose family sugar isomerase [Clostridium boliviensis]MDW2799480.1 D-lyxose/D-mannose family sugar isomerase [Clostridium boliviensis]